MIIDGSVVKINEIDLRKIQLTQLEILKEVKRICDLHDIKYCVIAGTTLGAIRHKGFIPWDDDADIAMLRDEYERFKQVVENELDTSRFVFQDGYNTEQYRWGYGKLRRKDTLFCRSGQNHLEYFQGVFIDIFPLDHVPTHPVLRGMHNLLCFGVRKIQWSEVGKYTDRNPLKRSIYRLLSMISKSNMLSMYERLVYISNKRETELVRILTFPTPKNKVYGYMKKWYTQLQNVEFEGEQFPIAKDSHGYLTFKFGDYMSLPPLDQRNGHSVCKYKV